MLHLIFGLISFMALAMPMATLIVNSGRAIATNLISGIGGTVPKYVAWGTGAGTAAAADTTLFTESSETRTTGTVSRTTVTTTNDSVQVVGAITATAGRTITNAGLFDAVSSGNLYLKGDFTGLAILTGDSISFTFTATYS